MNNKKILVYSIIILLFVLFICSARATSPTYYVVDSCSNINTIDFHPVNYQTTYFVETGDYQEGHEAFEIIGSEMSSTTDYLTFNKFNDSFAPLVGNSYTFGFWLREVDSTLNGTSWVVNWIRLINGADWIQIAYNSFAPTTLEMRTSLSAYYVYGVIAENQWEWIEINVITGSPSSAYLYINGTHATGGYSSITTTALTANYYVQAGHGSGNPIYYWGDIRLDGMALYNVETFPPTFPTTSGGTTTGGVNLLNIPIQLSIALGISVLTAGLICGFILELCFVLPVLIFTDNALVLMIFSILGICTGVAIGWLPYVCLILIILIVALLYAGKVRDLITGGATGEEK